MQQSEHYISIGFKTSAKLNNLSTRHADHVYFIHGRRVAADEKITNASPL